MYNASPELVAALQTVLPNTRYELFCDSSTPKPCITYMQINDRQMETAEGFGYSRQSYYIKLWGKTKADMATYMTQIDQAMRNLGFTRDSFRELAIDKDICYIWLYSGLVKETFNN